jgi:4a-hydroxytetrahydrobiopterin dehydratase
MLRTKHCVPCEGGVPPVGGDELERLLKEVPAWEVRNGRLHRHFAFRGFTEAMRFVNAMAEVAESEGHHPDFTVHYREVDVEVWTHAIGGLSENDFILAAKIDEVAGKR